MTLQVVFQQPAFSVNAPLSGHARASEAVAAGASGSLTAQDGEIAIVTNMGTTALYFAFGSTPNASATAATAATSARHGIGPGNTLGIVVNVGDKFAAASS